MIFFIMFKFVIYDLINYYFDNDFYQYVLQYSVFKNVIFVVSEFVFVDIFGIIFCFFFVEMDFIFYFVVYIVIGMF